VKRVLVATALLSLSAPAFAQGKGHPPEELFTACSGRASGDACTVRFQDKEFVGTCMTFPKDGRLFCRPTGAPKPPS